MDTNSQPSTYQARIIRAELILKGLNLSDVARRCDVTPSAVSRVVARQSRSRKIEGEICRLVGRPRRDLFPVSRCANSGRSSFQPPEAA